MLCKIRQLWRTTKYFLLTGDARTMVSGCILNNHEMHENCTVYVSYCEHCGKSSIMWKHGGKVTEDDRENYGNVVCKHC